MTFACETPRPGAAALFALGLQEKLPTLRTARLILRAPRVTDFDTFAQIACSERGRYLDGPMTREDAWTDFAQMTSTWLLHGHGIWTIGYQGSIAGFVLLGFEPGDMEPELGFVLTAAAEGQGLATEAAAAARTHAFETLGWSTLVSYIDPANTRAQATARRLGAHQDDMQDDAQVWRCNNGGHVA
ncbi:GNAT family N-acetyltransferase [uncultured Roseobacter sp.]|uniref:GNAT family N-acetyltransferase n=1 Tax=uncultured Roseobacter sp. TaxID=114847 RepID=UPI0026073F4E|nr:GNAT family N-acetyltransferase [uncultured Roseobacter sp.]